MQDTHQGFSRWALLAAPKGEWPTSELRPVELPRLARPKRCFAAYCARSMDELLGHYRQTWIRQAGFSLCHRRDGRAGTTILQLVSASYNRTKALPSDYGPARLLEQGQHRTIRRRRTVLRDYVPEEAASSRRRAVGTTGPFQGPRADREQRTLPSIPPWPQYLSRTYGPGRIRRMAMLKYTAASG